MRKLTKKIIAAAIIILEIILLIVCNNIASVLHSSFLIGILSILVGILIAITTCTIAYFMAMCINPIIEKSEQKKQKIEEEQKGQNPEEREYNPKDIFLLTTEIISNCDDGSGLGPRIVDEYYLATKKDENFYELFSKVKIEKEEDTHSEGVCCKNFNTPYIVKVEPLTTYVKDPDKKLTADVLFGFITQVNTDIRIKDLTETDEDDEENDDDEVEEE